jgi:hypothetical protein
MKPASTFSTCLVPWRSFARAGRCGPAPSIAAQSHTRTCTRHTHTHTPVSHPRGPVGGHMYSRERCGSWGVVESKGCLLFGEMLDEFVGVVGGPTSQQRLHGLRLVDRQQLWVAERMRARPLELLSITHDTHDTHETHTRHTHTHTHDTHTTSIARHDTHQTHDTHTRLHMPLEHGHEGGLP